VPATQTSNVEIFRANGSNTFNAPIGIRKHRYRIAKVELVNGTNRVAPVRRADNFSSSTPRHPRSGGQWPRSVPHSHYRYLQPPD
jgi:expansin (peptidoglycan-binding protein)